jgi:uroporphyrin-III C-methyltransferase
VNVGLVGAGPGDPGLITVRGLELLRACDVLVHDRLVAPELLDEAPPHAVRVSREGLSQESVNDLLVDYARLRQRVVRLKGGDPFLFGRGGEEALALARAGIPFEVVPGVSALTAVPAAAGIPITHRRLAAQITVVAGRTEHADFDADWHAIADQPGTLVVFMGLARLGEITAALLEAGKDPDTPAAVIARGTRPDQHVVRAPLRSIAQRAERLPPPALLVVGHVVSLSEILDAPRPAAAAHR